MAPTDRLETTWTFGTATRTHDMDLWYGDSRNVAWYGDSRNSRN